MQICPAHNGIPFFRQLANQNQPGHPGHVGLACFSFTGDGLTGPPRRLHQFRHIDAEPGHGWPGQIWISAAAPLGQGPTRIMGAAKQLLAGTACEPDGISTPSRFGQAFDAGYHPMEQIHDVQPLTGKQYLRGHVDFDHHRIRKIMLQLSKMPRAGHVGRAAQREPIIAAARLAAELGEVILDNDLAGRNNGRGRGPQPEGFADEHR